MFQKAFVVKAVWAVALLFCLLLSACSPSSAQSVKGNFGIEQLLGTTSGDASEPTADQPQEANDTPEAVNFGGSAAISGLEFVGLVTSIGPNTWVVNGLTVFVNAQTEIKAGIALNEFAKVHAIVQADGSLLAREIELIEAPAIAPNVAAEIELTGTLTAINGNVWVVIGFSVIISPLTEIEGDIEIGDLVKVEGVLQADGTVLAREIEAAEVEEEAEEIEPAVQREFRFSGIVENISGTGWVIGGQTVLVNMETRLEDRLAVGVRAEVRGVVLADGSFLARRIKLDNTGPGSFSSGSDDNHDDSDDDGDDQSGSSESSGSDSSGSGHSGSGSSGGGSGSSNSDSGSSGSGSGGGGSGSSGSGSSGGGDGGDD